MENEETAYEAPGTFEEPAADSAVEMRQSINETPLVEVEAQTDISEIVGSGEGSDTENMPEEGEIWNEIEAQIEDTAREAFSKADDVSAEDETGERISEPEMEIVEPVVTEHSEESIPENTAEMDNIDTPLEEPVIIESSAGQQINTSEENAVLVEDAAPDVEEEVRIEEPETEEVERAGIENAEDAIIEAKPEEEVADMTPEQPVEIEDAGQEALTEAEEGAFNAVEEGVGIEEPETEEVERAGIENAEDAIIEAKPEEEVADMTPEQPVEIEDAGTANIEEEESVEVEAGVEPDVVSQSESMEPVDDSLSEAGVEEEITDQTDTDEAVTESDEEKQQSSDLQSRLQALRDRANKARAKRSSEDSDEKQSSGGKKKRSKSAKKGR